MPSFSKTSIAKLETCHPELQRLFLEVVKTTDCTVICGHRGARDQMLAYETRHSKVKWPLSPHNQTPSMAVDVGPYPLVWTEHETFDSLAEVVLETAKRLGIKVRWGGHFKTLIDKPHWELEGWRDMCGTAARSRAK